MPEPKAFPWPAIQCSLVLAELVIRHCRQVSSFRDPLPIFTGDANHYRSWRKRAWTHMENIKDYVTTPTYYTALSIVHSKIQGEAADILINHDTKFNFYSIINRLDYTYADQRPLYVLLDGMKRLKQGKGPWQSSIAKSASHLILHSLRLRWTAQEIPQL